MKGKKGDIHKKKMESEIYKKLEEPSHQWIKCNINPTTASAIKNIQDDENVTEA